MNLELDTFEYEDDLQIGTLHVEQIENSTKVIIELFPNNQSKESFENAEFSQVRDILELAVKRGYNLGTFPMPDNATEDDLTELSMSVFGGVDILLETILNLQDFKGVKVNFEGEEIEVYPILEKLRKEFLIKEITYFTQYRSTEAIKLLEDTGIEVLEVMYKAINTINETDEERTKNLLNSVDVCTNCGCVITGNTCQDENENIICEDCLIQKQAHRMGLE